MEDLTTATPVEIDTELSGLYQAEFTLEAKVAGALLAIRRGLGQRATVTGRGAYRREDWPTTGDEAVAAMRSKGEELIGMMRPASALVDTYDAAVITLAENRTAQAVLNAEYARRPWTRFYYVTGGHVHRTMRCSTCNNGRQRTRFEWLLEWSGRDEAEAIAALAAGAHTLCSQPCCFPGAPVAAAPARKTAAERAADRAAAAQAARVEDPKLIADTDGSPLVVDGDTIRTVRTAEIKGVDALMWAAYARHTGKPSEEYALRHEGHARKVAAALAHKRGTSAAAELAALVVKALKKVRRDLGAEVHAAAAAVWTAQAEAAELEQRAGAGDTDALIALGLPMHTPADADPTDHSYAAATGRPVPAPMTSQPQIQHAGRDEDLPIGASWATWEGHGRPAAALLFGAAGVVHRPDGPGEPVTFTVDGEGRIVARSVGGRFITTSVPTSEWLLFVPSPAGDEAACRFCGCTEDAACPGGCAWASDDVIAAAGLEPMDGDVCTACLTVPGLAIVQEGDGPARAGTVYLVQSADVDGLVAGAGTAVAGAEVLALRMRLAAIGQVTRELDNDQVAELGRRLDAARPMRSDAQLDPFLAARLAAGDTGTGRRCCTVDSTDDDCERVHPGFTTPTAALAALAAELEAEAADPGGYLAAHLAAIDDDAAAVRAAKKAGPGVQVLTVDPAPGADDYTPGDFGREITELPAGAGPVVSDPAPGSWYGWRDGRRVCTFPSQGTGDAAIRRRDVDAISPAEHYGRTRQQAHLERDQDDDYNEGDEARDCVRVSVRVDASGQRWQWCAYHRKDEPIGPDDGDLDDAAAFDSGLAEVLAIAAAAPPAATVTVLDPAGVLDLVRQYADEWHRFLAITPETASIDDADRAEAAAAGTLSRIAEALGVAGDSPAAAVPAPRLGDAPPAG